MLIANQPQVVHSAFCMSAFCVMSAGGNRERDQLQQSAAGVRRPVPMRSNYEMGSPLKGHRIKARWTFFCLDLMNLYWYKPNLTLGGKSTINTCSTNSLIYLLILKYIASFPKHIFMLSPTGRKKANHSFGLYYDYPAGKCQEIISCNATLPTNEKWKIQFHFDWLIPSNPLLSSVGILIRCQLNAFDKKKARREEQLCFEPNKTPAVRWKQYVSSSALSHHITSRQHWHMQPQAHV